MALVSSSFIRQVSFIFHFDFHHNLALEKQLNTTTHKNNHTQKIVKNKNYFLQNNKNSR